MRIAFYGNFQVDYCSEVHHAKSLVALGHEVICMQEPKLTAEDIFATALTCDLFVWVSTHGWVTLGDMSGTLRKLREAGIPSITYHLDTWMGLQRQREMSGPYWQLEHFFTVDRLMADWLNENTPVLGHYLTAGVYGPECYMAEPGERFDVAFVGSRGYHPEWPYRPRLVDWLHNTYGDRFRHYGGDGMGTVRGRELNQVYANARVVVGDSLCLGFDRPDYWSDRVYETLGRGGFLIHPYIEGMEDQFQNPKHLEFYKFGDFDQLKTTIDWYLRPENAHWLEKTRRAGHEHVKANHTYKHRWESILDTVFA